VISQIAHEISASTEISHRAVRYPGMTKAPPR
jgi:hypothetical protein